jgi:hypothetical protein
MRRHISPALVLSVLAIILATTAGATAASSLITGKQIKNSSITSADIKNSSIAGDDLKGATIGPSKLSDGLVNDIETGKDNVPGPAGPAGPAGAAGPQGPNGGLSAPANVDGNTAFQGAFGSGSEVASSTATCPAGSAVTGGGFKTGSIEDFVEYAQAGTGTYTVIAVNEFSQAGSITAQAVCVPAGGSGVARAARSSSPSTATLVHALQAKIDARR